MDRATGPAIWLGTRHVGEARPPPALTRKADAHRRAIPDREQKAAPDDLGSQQ
ncbi:hypothetical protein ACFWBB_09985 [Streptomyces sp. NPDC060000]|uniref:hypothetical protein n=1 Tax=Streptomyces sp. NPDC060000 TaxID=3347031 RepID=UPI00368C4AC1